MVRFRTLCPDTFREIPAQPEPAADASVGSSYIEEDDDYQPHGKILYSI